MDVEANLNDRLGTRVSGLRTERALSVKDLSDLTGLTTNMVRRVERSSRNFRSFTLCRFARAFQVDPDYFTIRDPYLAQAMRDPAFAAQVTGLAQDYFRQPIATA